MIEVIHVKSLINFNFRALYMTHIASFYVSDYSVNLIDFTKKYPEKR